MYGNRQDQDPLEWFRQLVGDTDVPARKIRPNRFSITGYVSTTKSDVSQEAESSLEHDFLILLEFDKRVERFLAQPFTLNWEDDEHRSRRYTPDVIVKYARLAIRDNPYLRTTLFEVKPREILKQKWAEFKPVYRAAMSWARERDCQFHLVTEQEIRTDYLVNVKFLLNYRSQFLKGDPVACGATQAFLLEHLRRLGPSTPRQLLAAISSDVATQAKYVPWIWNLVLVDEIGIDLTKRLTMASLIWAKYDRNSWE